MSGTALAEALSAGQAETCTGATTSSWLGPWAQLDDAALLAHFRGPRPVPFAIVADEEETHPERIEALMHGEFRFNGEPHTLAEPLDWLRNPSADVEWHILLHKFYYAVGLGQAWQRSQQPRYAARWCELLEGWMAVVPPGFIAADVTGRRVQNWLYSLRALVFDGAGAPIEGAFLRRVLLSLHAQVEYLCEHLTPKRNHRTLELMAIMLAGVALPEFTRAAHWRELALRETAANVCADLLSDGVHCELSTDYHHLALRNWLQVRQLAARQGMAIPSEMDAALQRALDFSAHVHQPNGQVPSFSDGDVHSYLALLAEGARLYGRADWLYVATQGCEGRAPAARMRHFAHGGYHTLRSHWGEAGGYTQAQHLVLDAGPVGEGNHGHFDALSFELAAHGQALVVDPGRYTYSEAGTPNWRVHFRSTAAHNTVCVDGLPQTRYLPRPVKDGSRHASGQVRHRISGPGPQTALRGAHASAHLDVLHACTQSAEYDVRHERVIACIDQRLWIVSDSLRSPSRHHYAARLQLHASAQGQAVLHEETGVQCLHSPALRAAVPLRPGQQCVLEEGWVSRLYGQKRPAPRLCATATGEDEEFDAVLLPLAGTEATMPALQVSLQDIGATRQALHIRAGAAGDEAGLEAHTWFHAGASAHGEPLGPGSEGLPVAFFTWAGITFSGTWLHLRHGPDGAVRAATTHAGAQCIAPPGVRLQVLAAQETAP